MGNIVNNFERPLVRKAQYKCSPFTIRIEDNRSSKSRIDAGLYPGGELVFADRGYRFLVSLSHSVVPECTISLAVSLRFRPVPWSIVGGRSEGNQ